MKLWRISQDVNNGYDTYSDAVVAAETEEEARMIHPSGKENWNGKAGEFSCWCNVTQVKVYMIGIAREGIKKGLICTSYHAG